MPPKKITEKWIYEALEDSSDDEAPRHTEASAMPKLSKQTKAQLYEEEMFQHQDNTSSLMSSLSPEELERIGLGNLGLAHTVIQDNYTGEGNPNNIVTKYSIPLSYKEGLPRGWKHYVSYSGPTRGLSYWSGPVTYIDQWYGKSRPQTIKRTIWDFPSDRRLAEEAKYLNLTRYNGRKLVISKNVKKVNTLLSKMQSSLSDKIDKRKKDLEEDSPGGKSLFGEKGVKPHELQQSAIFPESELKVGGKTKKRRRKKKRKTRRKKKGSGGVFSRPVRVRPIDLPLNTVPVSVVNDVVVNIPDAREVRMAVPYDDGERDEGMRRLRQGLNNNNSTRPINPLRQVLENNMENNRRNQQQRRQQRRQERINRAWEGGKRKKKRKKKTKKRKRKNRKKRTRRKNYSNKLTKFYHP